MALEFTYKQQWHGTEAIWLVEVEDPTRDIYCRKQGVYLFHDRMRDKINMSCTRLKANDPNPVSMPVYKLNYTTGKWEVVDELFHLYNLWVEANKVILDNLTELTTPLEEENK